jgi:hypothetical protein
MTFSLAHRQARRQGHGAKLSAFDSFEGLPGQSKAEDEHPLWKQGAMSTSEAEFHAICASNGIPRDEYHTVPGFYDQTLPQPGATGAPPILPLPTSTATCIPARCQCSNFCCHGSRTG